MLLLLVWIFQYIINIVLYLQGGMIKFSVDFLRILLMLLSLLRLFRFIIIVIILLQGGTIKFIVDYLHIDRSKNAKKSLCEEINSKLFEHIMTGIEVQAFENQNNFDFAHIIRNFMSNPLIASNLRTQ